ncbi:decarboxylase [Salmonella enterica subsp. indica]|uniref:Decarboxylase n=1 Tax=Salmonella enterica subsp. indica TaxID=59207 RepID=A0A379XLI7_SALER|nr:decarboxylase [Salmonella enterica subsp. indica]
MRVIVGMTGATGAPLGVALLQALRAIPDVETHLVMSKWGENHYRTGDALHAR